MDRLVELLTLEQESGDSFVAPNAKGGWVSIFGGQIVAQALAAASATVGDDRLVHSLHAYFLRPAVFDLPIGLAVERERDGGSFSSRRVIATQRGKPILSLIASFHTSEQGPVRDITVMPDVPAPETLEALADPGIEYGREASDPSPLTYIDVRPVEACRPFDARAAEPPFGKMWLRVRDSEGADPAAQRALLAYVSDLFLISTALQPHRGEMRKGAMVASIDHSLWIHEQPNPHEWMLYVQESNWAAAGRTLCRGSIFSRDGRLLATVVQEGLLRLGN